MAFSVGADFALPPRDARGPAARNHGTLKNVPMGPLASECWVKSSAEPLVEKAAALPYVASVQLRSTPAGRAASRTQYSGLGG